MENKLKLTFDAIHMPENCIRRIENAIENQDERSVIPCRGHRFSVASLCLIFVLLLFFGPTVVRAFEAIVTNLTAGTSYIDGEYYYYNDGKHIFEGHHDWESVPDASAAPVSSSILSASLRDKKLYFIANGEKIDISDQISYETPYTYTYTDEAGLTHYIAVGGAYAPETGLNHVGVLEFLQYKPEAHGNPEANLAGWIGGYSDNYCDPEGNAYPWVKAAFAVFELPFSPPGN